MLLPRGFSDDLSLIGKGSASVVLTHDKNLLGGQTTMELLNKIRSDYEPNVHFIVVDNATLKGREFMQRQQVGIIDAVIGALLSLCVIGWSLYYRWYVAKVALEVPALTASMLVVGDLAMSIVASMLV